MVRRATVRSKKVKSLSSVPALAGVCRSRREVFSASALQHSIPQHVPVMKSIPEGMHTVTPHLICAGAAEAIEFYKKAFGAVELSRMPGPDGKVMHASIRIGDSVIMLNDEFPEWGSFGAKHFKGSPVIIHLYVENADAAFDQAMRAGAKVTMPLADMFWGDRYGKVEDPFGHQWSIGTHIRDVTPEQMQKAMEQMGS
jgi:PhnB protein